VLGTGEIMLLFGKFSIIACFSPCACSFLIRVASHGTDSSRTRTAYAYRVTNQKRYAFSLRTFIKSRTVLALLRVFDTHTYIHKIVLSIIRARSHLLSDFTSVCKHSNVTGFDQHHAEVIRKCIYFN